jgi:DNA-binding transcriptional LysR family regulator
MEERLGVRLLNRTTRRLSLTGGGEVYFQHAQRILSEIEEMERIISSSRAAPAGCCASTRRWASGVLYRPGDFPVQSPVPRRGDPAAPDRPPGGLPDEATDIAIRFGEIPDSRLIAKKIASNRRLLCASPPTCAPPAARRIPQDCRATSASCCARTNRPTAAGAQPRQTDGDGEGAGQAQHQRREVALNWALDGHGILMRAEWDVAKYLRSGRLERVLADYETPPADVYAVYMERLNLSAKVAYFLDYLRDTSASTPTGRPRTASTGEAAQARHAGRANQSARNSTHTLTLADTDSRDGYTAHTSACW